MSRNENFAVVLDTFHDRRNGFYFQTNPLSAIRDQAITDEGNQNQDWNTIWDVRSARFEQGWTLEMVIPFKSLRYAGSGPQTWGINLRRIVMWKNETTFISAVDAAYGNPGIYRFSDAGTLVGLETPAQSMNLEIKPYAISTLATDNAAAEPYKNDPDGNAGLDVKYGLTRSLIADFTLNPDFSQVEDDVQQVNLTRFSLFYPEKREFFLEGQGIFAFGSLPRVGGGEGGTGGGDELPVMFFSRRIGLQNNFTVPVRGGGRVTGKAGTFSLGILNVQTGDKAEARAEATNFTVVRVKRDILRRSMIGLIATHRAPDLVNNGGNTVLGFDANILRGESLSFSNYYARSRTPGLDGNDTSWRTQVDYNSDRYGASAEHMRVGEDFNPEVGFLRREDFRRSFASARFSPRPKNIRGIRKFTWAGQYEYYTNSDASVVENKDGSVEFRIDLENSDVFTTRYLRSYEYLDAPFRIAPGVIIPVGSYDWARGQVTYNLGSQRRISGGIITSFGSFYDGALTELTYNGRIEVTPRIAVEPNLTLNWVQLPVGDFKTRLVSTRLIFARSARSVFSSLVQFNADAHTLTSNFRYRWEYRPGSELFVVYSDGHDTSTWGSSEGLVNRSFAVKMTRLFRL
jgi:hypothetical protein